MPNYYPSCVVNLRVRFDESLQVVDLPEALDQTGEPVSTPEQVDPRPVLRPLITERGSDNLTQILNRVPKSASVELPGHRQAGSFSLEFDWRELPIDPRLMSAIGVEVYLGTVAPEDFARGMAGAEASGRRRSILSVTDDAGVPRDDLLLLAGVVDNWFVAHDEKASIVKLDGRDLRGMFLDSPIDPDVIAKIDLKRPLPEVVRDICATHPAGQLLRVEWNDGDWPSGSPPSPAVQGGVTRVRRGVDGAGADAGSGSGGVSYWDLITQYCFLVGAIPTFRGRVLVVRPAATVFDQSRPTMSPAHLPFRQSGAATSRHVPGEAPLRGVRRVVYGRDLSELTFERKYAGQRVAVVEVTSVDTSSTARGAGKLLTAQWPPKSETEARRAGVSPSGEVAQQDLLRVPVPGIRDKARLLEIARALFEEIGRGELGGSIRTKNLASFAGDNADPDLLRLRPGDAVEVLVDQRALSSRSPLVATLVDDDRLSFEAQVERVRAALAGKTGDGDVNLARVIVASARSLVVDQMRHFRVANVRYTWGRDSVEVAFDFQNYVVLRHQVGDQRGPSSSPNSTTSAPRRPVSKRRRPASPTVRKRPAAAPGTFTDLFGGTEEG